MISHDSYHHQGRRVSDRPVVFWLKFWIRRASDERRRALTSTAFVSEEKETSARGRLVGIARAVHRRSRLRVSFSCLVCFPLVVVLWCVGNPDLWDRGLVCFWGTFLLWLVYPNLPIAWAQARARITQRDRSVFGVQIPPGGGAVRKLEPQRVEALPRSCPRIPRSGHPTPRSNPPRHGRWRGFAAVSWSGSQLVG